MDNWIYEKINKVSDLEDRALLKKIMLSVFSSLEEYTESRYDYIENRVFNEISVNKKKYTIYSSVVERTKINPISEFLFPILEEDKEESIYEIKTIRKAIKYKEELFLFKVFLQCDYLKIIDILKEKATLNGIIETDKKIHKAQFIIEENIQYKQKIKKLYENFIFNNIPWETVNIPYINKIVNVVLVGVLDEIAGDEKILKIDVDFGEYTDFVKYDMVPLWNIRENIVKTNGFASPCIDKINFEHSISINPDNGYLISFSEGDDCDVIFKEDSISILSLDSERNRWGVYEFLPYDKEEADNLQYKIMDNGQIDSFSNRISTNNNQGIKTKSELIKLINSYSISKYIKFIDLKLIECSEEANECYELNDFIADEIREGNIKKVLMMYFKPCNMQENTNISEKANYDSNSMEYLFRDILSFIVSKIQFIYPEYKCEGRLT